MAVSRRARTRGDLGSWLSRHKRAHPTEIELGLARVREVARRAGLLPAAWPVITVAGTNGKGSTVAMLESVLRAHGLAAASYTSPHMHRYNERVKVGGECASDEALCEAFEVIERRRGDTSLSFFEVGTLAALYHFHRCAPDVVVLETGLGGRLDAVNIVDADVAVITSIGIDHTEWLGGDRESIAFEKAGITRRGRPCIYGDPRPPRGAVEELAARGVEVERLDVDFGCRRHARHWDFASPRGDVTGLPYPALYGDVQLHNACCALAALAHLTGRLAPTPQAARRGLGEVRLAGRFQMRRAAAAGGGECLHIFDIAHNPHGALVMARNLGSLPGKTPLHAVFSMLSSKDVEGVVKVVAPLVDCWYLSETRSSDALPLGRLCEIVRRHARGPVRHFASVARAWRAARAGVGAGERLLAFGSMLTVAEALAEEDL